MKPFWEKSCSGNTDSKWCLSVDFHSLLYSTERREIYRSELLELSLFNQNPAYVRISTLTIKMSLMNLFVIFGLGIQWNHYYYADNLFFCQLFLVFENLFLLILLPRLILGKIFFFRFIINCGSYLFFHSLAGQQ